ncbi:MAG: hypothetical protein Q4E55_03920 [Bacteroidales bacterium]|nr:hypothetical protein [Bacteroidales bacterium]
MKEITNTLHKLIITFILMWVMVIVLAVLCRCFVPAGLLSGNATVLYVSQLIAVSFTFVFVVIIYSVFNRRLLTIRKLNLLDALKKYQQLATLQMLSGEFLMLLDYSFWFFTQDKSSLCLLAIAIAMTLYCTPTRSRLIKHLDLDTTTP